MSGPIDPEDEFTDPDHLEAIAREWCGVPGFVVTDDASSMIGVIVRHLDFDDGLRALTFTGADGEAYRVLVRDDHMDELLGSPIRMSRDE